VKLQGVSEERKSKKPKSHYTGPAEFFNCSLLYGIGEKITNEKLYEKKLLCDKLKSCLFYEQEIISGNKKEKIVLPWKQRLSGEILWHDTINKLIEITKNGKQQVIITDISIHFKYKPKK